VPFGSGRVAFDDHGFERAANDAVGLCWRLFMFVFRPLCMAHSLVMAGENAPCGAPRTRTRAGDVRSLTSVPTHRWSLVGCSAPRSSIHEVDAVLAGGRAAATTNSCTGNRDKAPRGSAHNFWS